MSAIPQDDDALADALQEALSEAESAAPVAAIGHQVRVPDGTEAAS